MLREYRYVRGRAVLIVATARKPVAAPAGTGRRCSKPSRCP